MRGIELLHAPHATRGEVDAGALVGAQEQLLPCAVILLPTGGL